LILARSFYFLAISLSILLSSVAARAQSRPNGARNPAGVIRAVNTDELRSLLKRDVPRPLLVNFWATWCDPCRDEFPDLVRIDEQYRSKGLDFIAVSLDDFADINTQVPKFLQEMHASMLVYLLNVPDPDQAINLVDPQWGGALPATFLYNAQGQIVYKRLGRINDSELRAAIEKLVGSKQ
jgi:thiol-disulfide isomerase/thioredoxin